MTQELIETKHAAVRFQRFEWLHTVRYRRREMFFVDLVIQTWKTGKTEKARSVI